MQAPSLDLSHASSVWEECQDDDGKVFFYNVHTGESSWHDPRGDDYSLPQSAAAHPARSPRRPPSPRGDSSSSSIGGGGDGTARPPSPRDDGVAGWEVAQDDDGAYFYFNAATGESTYERPDGAAPVARDAGAGGGGADESESGGNAAAAAAPLGSGSDWEEMDDGEGPYWYNNTTGESSWAQPEF